MTITFDPDSYIDLELSSGQDFFREYPFAQPLLVTVTITEITKSNPCVITAVGHKMPNSWPFWVESVEGMGEINRMTFPKQKQPWTNVTPYVGTVIDADHISPDGVDSHAFHTYNAGKLGAVCYPAPVNLTGFTANMTVYESEFDHTVIDDWSAYLSMAPADGRTFLNVPGSVSPSWAQAYYEITFVTGDGTVVGLAAGNISIT